MSDTSSRTKELFAAAKLDGPSETTRDTMWAGIQLSALPFAPNVPAAHLAAKAIASSKLALGIALGASITVGVAGAVLVMTRTSTPPSTHVAEPRALDPQGFAHAPEDRASVERTTVLRLPPTPMVITGHAAPATESLELDAVQQQQKPAAHVVSERDRLAQEARMVSEARGALHRGDPEVALRIVRAARLQHGARLVPEELTVEALALRAMGDEAGAKRAEAELAGKFPEQDLGH